MRSIIEQVDEFIEGMFDGSILYQNIDTEHLADDKTWISTYDDESIRKADVSRAVLDQSIEKYVNSKNDEEREKEAHKIYNSVIVLRSLGVIQTNIHVSKDVQFFKERCKQLESENKEYLEAYAKAKEKIKTLEGKPSKDFKGFS